MKTIEERANEHYPIYGDGYAENDIKNAQFHAYCKGATEQKAIDIEKACEWFSNYLMEIGHPYDWMRDSKVQLNGGQRFRKAMEE